MIIDERIKLANNIVKIIGVNVKVKELEDVDSKLFILFYEKLLKDKIEGKVECPVTEKEEYHNVVAVLDKLSREVLKVSLSHIHPMEVVRGQQSATINLLEIFQGLAECMKQQQSSQRGEQVDTRRMRRRNDEAGGERNKKGNNPTRSSVEEGQYRELRQKINATDKQVDNLARMTQQVVTQMGTNRERFLAEKIWQLIGGDLRGRNEIGGEHRGERERNDDALLEYVNEHQEQLASTRRSKMEECARARTRRRNNNRKPSGEARELSRLGCPDDELTCVTMNETVFNHSDDQDHVSCVSNETYVLESVDDKNECQETNLKNDIVMKDAWAQVNKDLVHQGYEKEFLDMLLDEEENINIARKQGHCNAKLLRKFSEQEISSRPLSAFDELLRNEDDIEKDEIYCRNDQKCQKTKSYNIQIRNKSLSDRGSNSTSHRNSFVRAVEKPLVKTYARRYTPSSIGSISERSTHHSDQEIITQLLDSFPGLQLSEQTIRHLWSQAAQQAASIQQSHRNFISKLLPNEQKVEDARRRQKLLSLLVRKEALQQIRLQEKCDERKAQIATLSTKEKQRQQSARAKRYVDEFAIGMKARMMHKQAREEQVFRSMFKEALKIQRDRINEMRRYARDVKNEHSLIHQKDLDSLENYYRDRFAMLADSLRKERNQINLQDKSQELALLRLKKEMRSKLENDIRMIQESLVESQHEVYFRELDAQRVLSDAAHK